jgi:hypothetical protein
VVDRLQIWTYYIVLLVVVASIKLMNSDLRKEGQTAKKTVHNHKLNPLATALLVLSWVPNKTREAMTHNIQ